MSDRDFVPDLLYFPMSQPEWRALHQALAALPGGSEVRASLAAALDAVQARANTLFAMVAWSADDLCGAVARRRGIDVDYGDPCTPGEAGLTQEDVESVMLHATSPLEEAMVVRGWDTLDDIATAFCDRELWWSQN